MAPTPESGPEAVIVVLEEAVQQLGHVTRRLAQNSISISLFYEEKIIYFFSSIFSHVLLCVMMPET